MKKFRVFFIFLLSFLVLSFCNYTIQAYEEEKVVYLTFDDGPSPSNTDRILDILKRNNVKASFFVVGKNVQNFPEVVKRMDRDYMSIYPHCYNHTYKELYQTTQSYFNDLKKCTDVINSAIGKEQEYNFVRMPGGSDNLAGDRQVLLNIKSGLISSGVKYIDWNVDSGDASAIRVSAQNIKKNVNVGGNRYRVEVVLMHDLENKDTTAEALEEIIWEYKAMGYNFKTLDKISPWEIDYLKNIRVINRG